jgi:hypothetical protein
VTNIFKQNLLFLFIALSPIGDFFLQATPLRSLGASPAIFPLLALAGIALGEWLASGRLKVNRVFLICLAYTLVITLYGLLFFGFSSLGESLIVKCLKSALTLGLTIFAATGIDYRVTGMVRTAIYVAFTLVILGVCFGSPNPFGLPPVLEKNAILHFTPTPDVLRPRGLASEPSLLSISAICFGLLSAYVGRTKQMKTLFIIVTVALLIASGSKGGIVTLFLCLMILTIIKWHSRWYHVVAVVLILLPLGLGLIWVIPNLFPDSGIAGSGSVATRLSMIICSLIAVQHHPFGVGFAGFLPSVTTYLPAAMYTLQSFFPVPLNFQEVALHLTSSDMVSTMTFFFDQLMYFGIPFAACFAIFVIILVKRLIVRDQRILAIGVLASAIAMTVYAGGSIFYAFPILFGAALSEVRNGANPRSSE